MLHNIKKILENSLIATLQKEKVLTVKGYTNLELQNKTKEFLGRIIFEDDKGKVYPSPLLQPETFNFFPLKSKLHKEKIIEKEGIVKEISIDFNKVNYYKYKNIENAQLQTILNKEFAHTPYTYYGIYENICIPSYVIGSYFYFKNTNIRRIFRNNTIDSIVHFIDFNTGDIILKKNVKYNNFTAILAYLFHCNKDISKAFKSAYNSNIDYTIQKNDRYASTLFRLPYLGIKNITLRGIEKNGYFIVYEIENFDFTQIANINELKVSYKGNKQVEVFKVNSLTKNIPTNQNELFSNKPYSNRYIETPLDELEISSQIDENNLKVKKVNPIQSQENFSILNLNYRKKENEGLTLGSFQEKSSNYAKASLNVDSKTLTDIKENLENKLNIETFNIKSTKDYSYLHFSLKAKKKEYLLIKLKRKNTAWYLLSTSNPPLAVDILANHLILIKDKRNNRYNNNNDFSRDIFYKYSVCFHTSLKNIANNFDEWIERLIDRINNNDCKGINPIQGGNY